MKIELHQIPVSELAEGYKNDEEEGVIGYGGRLNIRPKYQREFIYKEAQRNAVMDTLCKNFPLNVMYWVKNDDGTFEVMDGQQRTISICEYVAGNYSIGERYFHTLTDDEREQILNYNLTVYFCEGKDSEKLEWFKTINIAGERLTNQELRNAVYTGEWLTDAKRYFSKSGCPAYKIGWRYLSGSAIRQDYLETVLKWRSKNNICQYMADHQHDHNANQLWMYFRNIIDWVELTFKTYRKEMQGLEWGPLYDMFKDVQLDTTLLERQIARLMTDDDVTNKRGIYNYVLTNDEKQLNIRAFTDNMKRQAYEKQEGICPLCNQHFDISEMEGDHITPWSQGGKTDAANCRMLCRDCNRRKSDK